VKTIRKWRVVRNDGALQIEGTIDDQPWTTSPLVAVFGLLVRAESVRHLPWKEGNAADVSLLVATFPVQVAGGTEVSEQTAGDPVKTVHQWRVVNDGSLRIQGTIDGQPHTTEPLQAIFGLLVQTESSVRHLPWGDGSADDVSLLVATFPPLEPVADQGGGVVDEEQTDRSGDARLDEFNPDDGPQTPSPSADPPPAE
jgi:hypothetical protein